jgi:hypothetical protein
MKAFARYLELVATVQYLHGRGHLFGSDDGAFYWGSKPATMVVLAHATTLTVFSELLVTALQLSDLVRWTLRLTIWGLALAVFVFLQSNTPYLQELRERIRHEPGGSTNRESATCAFVTGSLLVALLAVVIWIAHAI